MADNSGGLGTFLDVSSSLLSVYSTYQRGKLRRILNRHNAAMKVIQADLVKYRTGKLVERLGDQESRELGAARAASVGEGFALDSGTNLDVEGDIITARAEDRAVIKASGGLEESRLLLEAGQDRLAGDLAQIETQTQVVSTLFGTTSRLLERI